MPQGVAPGAMMAAHVLQRVQGDRHTALTAAHRILNKGFRHTAFTAAHRLLNEGLQKALLPLLKEGEDMAAAAVIM